MKKYKSIIRESMRDYVMQDWSNSDWLKKQSREYRFDFDKVVYLIANKDKHKLYDALLKIRVPENIIQDIWNELYEKDISGNLSSWV